MDGHKNVLMIEYESENVLDYFFQGFLFYEKGYENSLIPSFFFLARHQTAKVH